ncbi:helix-turn-helix transcriptional regulator [Sphingobium sp. TomMM35A]
MRRPEVEAKIGLSRSTIYSAMAKGEFPRPLRIGRRAVGWRQSDIDEWLSRRDLSSGWGLS